MNHEAGVELKNRSNTNTLRAAVRTACIQGVLASTLLVGSLAHSADVPTTVPAGFVTPITFDIPAQSLETALLRFSEQARIQVVVANGAARGAMSPHIKGEFSAAEALQLLLEQSELTYEVTDERTIAIRAGARSARFERTSHASNVRQGRETLRVVNAQGAVDPRSVSQQAEAEAKPEQIERTSPIEEVLVTGSHIRGAQNLSSPVITFDREAIEASGYATVQQLIQSLPQSLNNVSDATFGGVNGGPAKETYDGSGPNLRGLGGDSTLVLLNGRRLPAAGRGDYIDISLIPLSAVERVDVLTDGASAIYGSDAVGGVINFILRENFDGAETRLRYGSVTQGSHDEQQAAQMFGHAWSSGHALLNYEYYRRSELEGADRDFIDGPVYRRLHLIPSQERQSALAVFSQQLSDSVELSADLLYSDRESEMTFDPNAAPTLARAAEVKQYGGSVELRRDFARGWQGRLSGQLARSDSERQQFWADTGVSLASYRNESRLWSVDLAADGSLGALPGGSAHLAVGSHFRVEDFTEGQAEIMAQLNRKVSGVYAELRLPWVGPQNREPGIERLEMSVAGRYEHYDDFGSSFNPKLGLSWAPIAQVNVRGTWGTSFKAPLLAELNPADFWVYAHPDRFVDTTEPATGLLLSGNGVDLGPEESTNWTVGFDVAPAAMAGLELSATYFDIQYEDRVRDPLPSGYPTQGVLLDSQYARLITRNPDRQLVEALLSGPKVYCYTIQDRSCASMPAAEEIDVIVDRRHRNLAAVRVSGIDFSASYRLDSSIGVWGIELSGTRLLESREQFAPGAPETSELNKVYRPVDLRLRNRISFSRGSLNMAAFVNYVDRYRDTQAPDWAGPRQRPWVASWTTIDLSVQYDLSSLVDKIGIGETILSLSATNLLDRDPPFVSHRYGLNFDGVNANPLGRFISAQVTARW